MTPDGYALYPEEKIEITVDEALVLANEVIEKYRDPEILFHEFSERERKNMSRQIYEPLDDATLRKEMESDLTSQRNVARIYKTKTLLSIMDLHKKYPLHYYGTVILAVAEEWKRRLEPSTP